MQIERFGHAAIRVRDLETAESFYGAVLGFPVVDRYPDVYLSTGLVAENHAREAGAAAMAVYSSDFGVRHKGDRSQHGDAQALERWLEGWLAGRTVSASTSAGSSLKFCLVAAGEADVYPRLGRTMEWDTAAGHAVLAAAGGRVATLDGRELSYGKPGLDNPHFVASGLGV